MLSPYLVLSFFAPLVLGKTTAPNLQLHEAVDNVPVDFVLSGPAAPDTVLNLRLALVQNNVSGLVDELYSVSDPSSANYGQYLSKEEVRTAILYILYIPDFADNPTGRGSRGPFLGQCYCCE